MQMSCVRGSPKSHKMVCSSILQVIQQHQLISQSARVCMFATVSGMEKNRRINTLERVLWWFETLIKSLLPCHCNYCRWVLECSTSSSLKAPGCRHDRWAPVFEGWTLMFRKWHSSNSLLLQYAKSHEGSQGLEFVAKNRWVCLAGGRGKRELARKTCSEGRGLAHDKKMKQHFLNL